MRSVATRREQYYAYKDQRGFKLAQAFTLAKIRNMYATLGTLAKRRKDTDPETAAYIYDMRGEVEGRTAELASLDAPSVDAAREKIMGLEGAASAKYWLAIARIIPDEFNFHDRSGRYAADPVNAMLNYGYGILEGEVWRGVHYAGLDPYGGFLHVDRPGKPSLVLDLMEEFRQQLIDKSIIKLISRHEVSPGDFTMTGDACNLGDQARHKLITEVLERLEEYVVLEEEKVRWSDVILRQARNIGRFLRGELNEYEGFWLRW